MIPVNGAPHDLEARDVHRRLSFAQRRGRDDSNQVGTTPNCAPRLAAKSSVPRIPQDSLWVSGNGEQPTLNIRQLRQTDGPHAGREQGVLKVCFSKVIATNSGQLYPAVSPCRIGSLHASPMFDHGAHVVVTQRDTELCAEQVDLKGTTVISGDGCATLIVNVAEIHRRIGISVVKRFS